MNMFETWTVPVSEEALARFRFFLEEVAGETYPEAPSEPHASITRIMLTRVLESYPLPQPARILDVGCGQGPALELIRQRGHTGVGVTINDQDIAACREQGFEVHKMDQSFLEFPEDEFDLIWARHCVEHSIMPYYTLHEFHRVLRGEGFLYLEVPAPDTFFHHETNTNHYSTLTQSAWASLLTRSGFEIVWANALTFDLPAGPDTYLMFIARPHRRGKS